MTWQNPIKLKISLHIADVINSVRFLVLFYYVSKILIFFIIIIINELNI